MQTLRLFIALTIPSDVQRQLAKLFKQLPLNLNSYRIVPAENMHITLKFLGTVPIDLIPELTNVLESLPENMTAPELYLDKPLLLPLAKPTTIALSVRDNEALTTIFREVEALLTDAQLFQPERRQFKPHITLARTKLTTIPVDDYDNINDWQLPSLTWHSYEIVLFESVLKPTGAEYSPLISIPLS